MRNSYRRGFRCRQRWIFHIWRQLSCVNEVWCWTRDSWRVFANVSCVALANCSFRKRTNAANEAQPNALWSWQWWCLPTRLSQVHRRQKLMAMMWQRSVPWSYLIILRSKVSELLERRKRKEEREGGQAESLASGCEMVRNDFDLRLHYCKTNSNQIKWPWIIWSFSPGSDPVDHSLADMNSPVRWQPSLLSQEEYWIVIWIPCFSCYLKDGLDNRGVWFSSFHVTEQLTMVI